MFEYLTYVPSAKITLFAFIIGLASFCVGFLSIVSFFFERVNKFNISGAVLSLMFPLCMHFFPDSFHEPKPEVSQVSAERAPKFDFSREIREGKRDVVASYAAYKILDEGNGVYYRRIESGTVVYNNIVLYKIKKQQN